MSWLAKRIDSFDSSGIRKVFDLAAKLENPINLSIGQPDFDVPDDVKTAAEQAIQSGKNGYTPTQGIGPLREKLQAQVDEKWQQHDRQVLITSGTSGGLLLTIFSLVDPGDEVILFDPYFVMYEPLVRLAGGEPIYIDTYPDFKIDVDQVSAAITGKTKLIVLNSPANPTGAVASSDEIKALAELALENNIALISDEIYQQFCYDDDFASPVGSNPRTIVIDGFSKSHAMTGWRLGFAHGPREIIESMAKLQQYSFVCAPQPAQWAGLSALNSKIDHHVASYRKKRDRLIEGLRDHFEIAPPGGAFYLFPKAPWGTGSEFVEAAIKNNLLIIPGNIFSRHDTHFRISYAAADETIDQGIETLIQLANEPAATS